MQLRKINFYFLITLVFSCLFLTTCANREETSPCFPNSNIDVVLQLNLPSLQPLQNVGGWIYVDQQESGTKGLIVVRTTNGFLAFDRNAPHICPDTNTRLVVENGIKIVCPNDGAEWILITGEPIKIAEISPKRYFVQYNSNTNLLSITN